MKVRIAAAAGTVALCLVASIPVQAVPASPFAGPMKFPVTVTATVPANGHTGIGSPTLPAGAKAVTISVDEKFASAVEDELIAVLPEMSNKNRLLTCASIGATNLSSIEGSTWDPKDMQPDLGTLRASALMNMCFQMVEYLAHTFPRTRTDTSTYRTGCTQTLIGLTVKITKSTAGYTVTPTGVGTLPRRGPLAIGCKASTDGIDLAVKARGKKKLAQVVGPSMGFGVVNLSTSAGSPISVEFGVPR